MNNLATSNLSQNIENENIAKSAFDDLFVAFEKDFIPFESNSSDSLSNSCELDENGGCINCGS